MYTAEVYETPNSQLPISNRIVSALLLAMALLVPAAAFAQGDARFTGTVLDPSGALVPNASIVIKNEKTGEERTVTSNKEGRYVIPNLKPATYTIRAKFGEFVPLEFTGLPLAAAQEFALDLTLQPPGVNESITVEASAGALELSSARNGVNVSPREVESLPVNGRQMSQLLLQAPGAVNSGSGTWQDIRFSGRAVEQNAIRYDGIEGSAIIDAAPGNLNGEVATSFKLQASLENVQEFRVDSNSYPAEFGTGTGGQVTVITKSGGNRFTGSMFEYFRDDSLDSRNYFDTTRNLDRSAIDVLPKSLLQQNQFGGSLGGPVVANKVFFFGSFEGYRMKAGLNLVEAVPSAAAWATAVPAIQVLRPNFTSPDAPFDRSCSGNAGFRLKASTVEDATSSPLPASPNGFTVIGLPCMSSAAGEETKSRLARPSYSLCTSFAADIAATTVTMAMRSTMGNWRRTARPMARRSIASTVPAGASCGIGP